MQCFSSCRVMDVLLGVCTFTVPVVVLQSTQLLCDHVSGSPRSGPSNMELILSEVYT